MSRNRASAKAAGRTWESAIVDALIYRGWPHAERRRMAGANDRGDIAGVVGVCIEAKNTKAISLAAFLDEAHMEQRNASARIGVAWIKRRGKASALDGYVVMDGDAFLDLLKEAGYQ